MCIRDSENRARHAGRQVKLTYMLVEAPAFEVVDDGRDGSDGCLSLIHIFQKDSGNSIPASEAKGNGEMENLEEMYRKMQRMACLLYTSYPDLCPYRILLKNVWYPARPFRISLSYSFIIVKSQKNGKGN